MAINKLGGEKKEVTCLGFQMDKREVVPVFHLYCVVKSKVRYANAPFLDGFKNSCSFTIFCTKKTSALQEYLHKKQMLFGSSMK